MVGIKGKWKLSRGTRHLGEVILMGLFPKRFKSILMFFFFFAPRYRISSPDFKLFSIPRKEKYLRIRLYCQMRKWREIWKYQGAMKNISPNTKISRKKMSLRYTFLDESSRLTRISSPARPPPAPWTTLFFRALNLLKGFFQPYVGLGPFLANNWSESGETIVNDFSLRKLKQA